MSGVKTVYKYPLAQNFFDALQSFYFVEEMHELLAVGVEFPYLEMVNIEPNHSIPNVDSLIPRLNE